MATVIDRLVTVLGYKVDPKGLDAAKKRLESFRARADQIGRGMVIVGAALTGIGAAVARPILDFERGMNRLAAVSGATAEQMAALREQAIQLGGSTAFSASQAADAQLQLAQAGFSVGETMVALPHVLNLAAAGALEMGEAAALVTSQLRAYGFEVDQAQRVTDVLALTASSANTTVSELGPAFRQVAPVAAGLGLSIEDTAAAIGVLRNNGLQAEQAGTAVRNILVRLIAPTSAAASALDELGAEGIGSAREELASLGVDADQIAQQMLSGDLVGAMRALGQAGLDPKRAADIFGVEGLAGGLALARQAAALEELRTKLNDSEGAAERMRLIMEAGLPGAVDSMKSAIETLMLRLGEAGLTDMLGRAAEAVRTIATAIAEAPAPLKKLMVGAIALGPALTGAGLALKVMGSAVEGLAGPFRTMRRLFSSLKIGDFILRMRLAAMDAGAFAKRMWQRAIPGLRTFRGHMLRATTATTAFARRMATAGIAALRSFARGLVTAGAAALRFAGRAIVAAVTGVVTFAATIWASMVPALTAFAAGVWTTTAALLANPITWIVIGIAALVAAIVLAIKHWDKIKQVAIGAWSAITGAVQAGVRWIVGAWERLRDGVVSIVNGIVDLLRSPVGRILALFNPVTAIIAYWEEISRAAGAVAQFFSGAFSGGITGAWNAIVGAFRLGWRHIKGFFDTIPGWVLWALAVLNPFIGVPLLIIRNWDRIKNWFGSIGESITGVWNKATTWIKDAWDNSIGGIIKTWNEAIGWIMDAWRKVQGFVGRVLGIVEVGAPESPDVPSLTQQIRVDREERPTVADESLGTVRAGWDQTAVAEIQAAREQLQTRLGEIRTKVGAWWDETAEPAVRRAWDRLKADTGEIAARVHAWWDEAAVPVLQAAWGRLRSQLGEISTPVRVWWDETALPAVRTAWDGVRERIGEITTHVRAQWDAGGPVAAVRAAWQELRSTVVEIVAPVRAWWDETAVPAVSAAWARLRAGLDEIVSPVRAQWDETATPALTAAWQDLRTTLGVMFAPVRARWDEGRPVAAVQAAWQGLRTGLDEIAAPVRAVWDQAAVPVVEAAWHGLQAGLGEIAPSVRAWSDQVDLRRVTAGLWDGATREARDVFATVSQVAVPSLERIKQGASDLLDGVRRSAPVVFGQVEGVATGLFDRVRRAAAGMFAGTTAEAPDLPPIKLGVAPTFDPAGLRDLWTRLGDPVAMQPFLRGVKKAWGKLTRWLQQPVELPELTTDYFVGLREAWSAFIDWMRQPVTLSFFRSAWGRLGDTVRRVVGAVDDRWQRLIAGLPAPLQTAATTIRTRLTEIWTGAIDGAREQWRSFASSIPEILRAGGAGLKTALENLWSGAVASVRTRWRTFVDGLPEPLQGAGRAAKTTLGTIWQGMLDHAGDRWQEFIDGLPESLTTALASIRKALQAVWDTWITELPGRLLAAIREGIEGLGGKILGIELFPPRQAEQGGQDPQESSTTVTVDTTVQTGIDADANARAGKEMTAAEPPSGKPATPPAPMPQPATQPMTVEAALKRVGQAGAQVVSDVVDGATRVKDAALSFAGSLIGFGRGRPAPESGETAVPAPQPAAMSREMAMFWRGLASGPHPMMAELSAPGVTNVSTNNTTRVNVTIENIDARGGDSAEIAQNIEQTLEQTLGERYHGMVLAADGPVDA